MVAGLVSGIVGKPAIHVVSRWVRVHLKPRALTTEEPAAFTDGALRRVQKVRMLVAAPLVSFG